MRPLLSRGVALALVALSGVAAPNLATAQRAVAQEGALFLLLPVGARAVGLGQATVAALETAEAAWYNPSGLAGVSHFEATLHHTQALVATGDAVTIVAPSPALGVLALSANVLSFGSQDISGPDGSPLGTLLPRSVVYAASYAAPVGPLNVGVTYKIVQLRFDCSGLCPPLSQVTASTSALDFGLLGAIRRDSSLLVGAALRNVGLLLQVNDREQADPLPTRIDVGVAYRRSVPEEVLEKTQLMATADVVDRLRLETPSVRIGLEAAYDSRLFARVGTSFDGGDGIALGVGVKTGTLNVDLARVLGDAAADAGEPSTYLSLRYVF